MHYDTNTTIQQNALTLTSSAPSIGTTIWVNDLNYYYGRRATDYTHWAPYVYPALPIWCSADLHVFGCEHANKCKCGKASRTPEPKACACCGK